MQSASKAHCRDYMLFKSRCTAQRAALKGELALKMEIGRFRRKNVHNWNFGSVFSLILILKRTRPTMKKDAAEALDWWVRFSLPRFTSDAHCVLLRGTSGEGKL
jgi:hypothetical protein